MSRLSSFVLGLVVGGAAVFTGLKYHVVRADDGLHLIPKQTAELHEVYVDIREFGPSDWAEHPELAAAILKSGEEELLQDAARDVINQSIDDLLQQMKSIGKS
jgi:hypothetical protein